jgi:hypothetical protein
MPAWTTGVSAAHDSTHEGVSEAALSPIVKTLFRPSPPWARL